MRLYGCQNGSDSLNMSVFPALQYGTSQKFRLNPSNVSVTPTPFLRAFVDTNININYVFLGLKCVVSADPLHPHFQCETDQDFRLASLTMSTPFCGVVLNGTGNARWPPLTQGMLCLFQKIIFFRIKKLILTQYQP